MGGYINSISFMKNTIYLGVFFCTIVLMFFSAETNAIGNKDLREIDNYLASLNSLEADFIQSDAQGVKRLGRFYVSKPNKLKIEYLDGDKEAIIVNEDMLIIYNPDLDETNYLSSEEVPLSLFSEHNFKLSKKAIITHLESTKNNILVEFILKSDEANRKITMTFSKEPMNITNISLGEEDSKVTIKLVQPKFNIPIEKNVFAIK